LPSDSRNWFG